MQLHALFLCCREARGLGFLEFVDERDAADAVRGLDRMVLGGREVSVATCAAAQMAEVVLQQHDLCA